MLRLISFCKITVLIVIVVALDSSKPVLADNKVQFSDGLDALNYERFAEKYNRSWNQDYSGEFELRFALFVGRTVEIFEHNMLFLKKEISYHLERNQFTDMSHKELSRFLLEPDDIMTDSNHDSNKRDKRITNYTRLPTMRTILDFRTNPTYDDGIDRLQQFLKSMAAKLGESVLNEIIGLREAFESYSGLNQEPVKPFHPLKEIGKNLRKIGAPLESWTKSAKEAFWEYLKDEGIVDVKKQIAERSDKVKRTRMRIDWRITKCISEPRQQGLCNSCYAISVISLVEYYYCREMGELQRFSPQYIVDCGHSTGMRGCKGGQLAKVGQFIRDYGLQLESDFPYTGQVGQCAVAKDIKRIPVKAHFKHWKNIHNSESGSADWLQYARLGPLLVGIGMPVDFFAYAGGIHDGHNCDPNMVHAMLLIGYGIQDGREFWLLQNSFSQDWGEKGYFRLAIDAPSECFNAVIVARASIDRS